MKFKILNCGRNIMKKRLLIIVVVILFFVIGLKTVLDDSGKSEEAYKLAVEQAEENIKVGLYGAADEKFNEALAIKESKELRCRMIESLIYVEQYGLAEKEMNIMLDMYPQDPDAYEYLSLYAEYRGDYAQIYDYAKTIKKRKIASSLMDELCEKHKYEYFEFGPRFVRIDPFYYGFSRIEGTDGKYGYMNTSGTVRIEPQYDLAATDTDRGHILVANMQSNRDVDSNIIGTIEKKELFNNTSDETEGFEAYFIDYTGKKVMVDTEGRHMQFDEIQAIGSGMMAVSENGVYRFINEKFNTIDETKTYLYAGTFSQGVAPVVVSNGWMLIDEQQNQIGTEIFDEIRVDEAGIAAYGGVFFGMKNGEWNLYSIDGTKISQTSYEDCCCSWGAGPIAVKKNGKWGFIDPNGETVIDYKYDGARSFANGMAAVAQGDLWGMINNEEKMVVPTKYLTVYEITNNGAVPVETEEGWTLLEFYSMK